MGHNRYYIDDARWLRALPKPSPQYHIERIDDKEFIGPQTVMVVDTTSNILVGAFTWNDVLPWGWVDSDVARMASDVDDIDEHIAAEFLSLYSHMP